MELLHFLWSLSQFLTAVGELVVLGMLMTGYLVIHRKSRCGGKQLETRWCGHCADHPAHTYRPYPDLHLFCLGGWAGRKVKV